MMKKFLPAVDPAFVPRPPENAVCAAFAGDKLLLKPDGVTLPAAAELPLEQALDQFYLGTLDDTPCLAVIFPAELPEPPRLSAVELRPARLNLDAGTEIAVCRGKSLSCWRKNHRFCGKCGSPLTDHPTEEARCCTACGALFYPVLTPAIIVAVTDEKGRLLLAHNAKFKNNVHGLIAGFVESGETLEQAVRRECMEEVGIELSEVRYFDSQSWPYPNALMIGFTAKAKDTVVIPDGKEILKAGFFTPADMPPIPSPGSIARRLIDRWQNKFHFQEKKS